MEDLINAAYLPVDKLPLGWNALSVLGPMGRSVEDTALLMAASVGEHALDPLSQPARAADFWPLQELDLSRLRVGVIEDFGVCAVEPGIRACFRDRVSALAKHVASCDPVSLPMRHAHRVFDIGRAEAFVAAFTEPYRSAPHTLSPNVRANVELAASITLADRAWAHLEQTRIARAFQRAFGSVDLIVAPVTPMSPFPWTQQYAETVDGQAMGNYYEWLALTYVVTLATVPALSLPCGVDDRGMPFGLQLIAPLRHDACLLAMARAVEQAFAGDPNLARPRPDFTRLREPRPELRAIVTHPPLTGAEAGAESITGAV